MIRILWLILKAVLKVSCKPIDPHKPLKLLT